MPSTTPRQVTSQGKLAAALHGATGNPRQGALGVVGVYGRQTPAVAGIEGLQQVRSLPAANLAHNDVIRAVAKRMAHEIADRPALAHRVSSVLHIRASV